MAKRTARTQNISRADAAALLTMIATEIAKEVHGPGPTKPRWEDVLQMKALFEQYGLHIPRPCNGDAHENLYIDHCAVCMPNWGTIFNPIKVK